VAKIQLVSYFYLLRYSGNGKLRVEGQSNYTSNFSTNSTELKTKITNKVTKVVSLVPPVAPATLIIEGGCGHEYKQLLERWFMPCS
jgi:hypothetical protein